MLTHTVIQSPAAAYSGVAHRRSIDPVSAQILARFARQEAILRMLGRLGRAAAVAVAGIFQRHGTYRKLSALPDYLLRDIGLRCDQIEAVAYKGMKRQPAPRESVRVAAKVNVFEPKPAVSTAPVGDTAAVPPLAA